MPGLPRNYRRAAETIPSFDFVDLASGLGIVNYFGSSTQSDSTSSYALVTSNVFSAHATTKRTTTGSTTLSFDTSPFNLPRTAKGTANFSVGMGVTGAGTVSCAVQVQKFDGNTASNISNNIFSKNIGGAGTTTSMALIQLPLNQTVIKKGESLRLVVVFNDLGNDPAEIGHDPQNRAGDIVSGASTTTAMNLFMPFRIDL